MTAILGFLALYILWIFYLAVMNLKRARDAGKLTRTAHYLGLPILYLGLALDCFVNLTVMTVLLFELPKVFNSRPILKKEWTVTARLQRHAHGAGWRQKIALWFAANLLDAFDPSGKHIK